MSIKLWFQSCRLAKCSKHGHVPVKERREGYKCNNGWNFGCVASKVCQTRVVCDRCGIGIEPPAEKELYGIHELSLQADRFAKLKEDGYLWDEISSCYHGGWRKRHQ